MNLDDCLNVYFENDERYADLLNGSIFQGRQVVRAEDLIRQDTKAPKPNAKTKQRDHLRRVAFGTNFAVLPLENQNKVDYQMPLRSMDYDVREYGRQVRELRSGRKAFGQMENEKAGRGRKLQNRSQGKEAKTLTETELLSGFRKEDRLYPCATIVLFFGEKWDGSTSLHEMIDFRDIPEEVRGMVQDYRINLVHIQKPEDIEKYRTDLRQVFAVVQCQEDKEKMIELLENDEAFQHLEEDALALIAEVTHEPSIMEKNKKGERNNMCRAIREMVEDGEKRGREEGRKEGKEEGEREGKKVGIEEGTERTLISVTRNLMERLNKTVEEAMDLAGIPVEKREEYMQKI